MVEQGFTAAWFRDGHRPLFVRVPEEFTTDLASIPRAFRWLISKVGRHLVPSIVHDFCYYGGVMTREEADEFYLDGMRSENVAAWKRRVMYFAVQKFGHLAWRKHRQRRGP